MVLGGLQLLSMMSNKNKPHKPKPIEKIKPLSLHFALAAATSIMRNILHGLNHEVDVIERRRRQQRKLIQFAKIREQEYLVGYLNQMLVSAPLQVSLLADQQPSSISMDTLAIASLDKTKSRSVKSIIFQQKTLSQSVVSEDRSKKSKGDRQQSIKLPLEPIEEIKFVSELRQKKYNQELQKKQSQNPNMEKEKSSKKQYKISVNFDYNGNILYRKNIQQGNLVLKSIQQKLMKQKIIKRADQPPEPQAVMPIGRQKYIKRSKSKIVEDEFTEFLDSQSLSDSIEINRGIRYSHNALVYQEKKTVISTKDLKSQLGARKLSKQELARIKQFDQKVKSDKMRKLKTEQLLKADSFTHQRSFSQANFKSSRFKKREAINIMNPELRSSMLIRLSQYEPYLVIEKEIPEDSNLYYEPKEAQSVTNQSEVSKNELESRSRMTYRSKITTKFPPITRKSSVDKPKQDELIISKLHAQLQSKLRI